MLGNLIARVDRFFGGSYPAMSRRSGLAAVLSFEAFKERDHARRLPRCNGFIQQQLPGTAAQAVGLPQPLVPARGRFLRSTLERWDVRVFVAQLTRELNARQAFGAALLSPATTTWSAAFKSTSLNSKPEKDFPPLSAASQRTTPLRNMSLRRALPRIATS
jgi:hypothetical protein